MPAISRAFDPADCRSPVTRFGSIGTIDWALRKQAFATAGPASTVIDLQGSATLSHWKDIQADFLDPSGLPVTDNIGDGRVWTRHRQRRRPGDARASPGSWPCIERRQDHQADRRIPDLLGSADGTSMEIPNIARVVARGAIDWRKSTRRRVDAGGQCLRTLRRPLPPRHRSPPWRGAGRISRFRPGLRVADDRRAISLSVTNLTDETGNRFAFGAPIATGADQITPLRPRTIRLGFEQAF